MSEKIIVVGGGIIGASTAYYLASKGKNVTLLEKKDLCAETSSACDQAVLLQTKQPGPLLNMAMESANLYASLGRELNKDIEYKKGGGMIVLESNEHKEMIENLVEKQQKAGLDVNIVSAKETHKRQKGLNTDVIGSTWSEQDAKVNSYKTTFSFAEAAEDLGAKVITGETVTDLLMENGNLIGVRTKKSALFADKVILATGVWTSQLVEKYGINIPIYPRRGQILVTEKLKPVVDSNLLSASYLAAKSGIKTKTKNKAQDLGVGLVMGQTKSGNILIGGSREFVGYDKSTTTEVIHEIAKAAINVFPDFKTIKIIRTFSGFRPYTPDKLPIIDQVKDIEGLYINAGHEGDGIALAPISGKVMAELVCDEHVSIDLKPMSYERFKKEA